MKIDAVVKKETGYIACVMLICSALMEAVFLVIGHFTWRVLLGNLFGYTFALLNFFLMAMTVQKAVTKSEDDAKTAMRASQLMRNLMLIAVLAVAFLVPCFNPYAAVITLLFPRIAIAIRPYLRREKSE